MKKLFLTAVVALCTLVASAQFMVVTTYDNDQDENMDKITKNMGVGFMLNDAFTLGIAKGDDVITAADAASGTAADTSNGYNFWLRYSLPSVEGAYATLQMPTEDGSDNMQIGLGMSFNVWNGLYLEPNFTMPTSKDSNGDRDGNFNFGLSYRF